MTLLHHLLHHLNGGEKPRPRESMHHNALNINIRVLCRAPQLEQNEPPRARKGV